jgi:hypothetical protein
MNENGNVLLIANSVIAIIHNWHWHRHHRQFASMPEEGEALTFKNITIWMGQMKREGKGHATFVLPFAPKSGCRLPI